jgi:hypothetical protein
VEGASPRWNARPPFAPEGLTQLSQAGLCEPSDRTEDPTLPWEHVPFAVDDARVMFAVLSERPHWVARAIVGQSVIGIPSRKWTLDIVGLVTETGLAACVAGSKEIRRRMSRWRQRACRKLPGSPNQAVCVDNRH